LAVAARGQVPPAARQAELQGDFVAAEKAYEEEVRVRPAAEMYQRLGLTRHLQSKFEAALPAFQNALRLDPRLWTSRLLLGMCLYRLNRFEEARVELERAGRDAPPKDKGRDEIDYWLAATAVAQKQPLSGLIVLERLLARSPARRDALELATRVYSDLGSSLWNRVAERSFDSAAGLEVHGHALEADGNIEGALEAYRRSQQLAPRRAGPATAAGRLLLSRGKVAEAREELSRDLALAPSDPATCFYAGLAAIQGGDLKAAAPLLETAVSWSSRDTEPLIALAQVQLALGRREQAAESARRALAIDPSSTAAREMLAAAQPR
jgi:tetratricopeptide (TPR) repeat protein